jgi:hypothetical protein
MTSLTTWTPCNTRSGLSSPSSRSSSTTQPSRPTHTIQPSSPTFGSRRIPRPSSSATWLVWSSGLRWRSRRSWAPSWTSTPPSLPPPTNAPSACFKQNSLKVSKGWTLHQPGHSAPIAEAGVDLPGADGQERTPEPPIAATVCSTRAEAVVVTAAHDPARRRQRLTWPVRAAQPPTRRLFVGWCRVPHWHPCRVTVYGALSLRGTGTVKSHV